MDIPQLKKAPLVYDVVIVCTKPLGRTADEALRMMKLVEEAGISAVTSKTCVTRPSS